MSVYILTRAVDGWNPDDPMVYNTGYIVHVRSRNQIGGMQVPPNFVQIELTDDGLDPMEIERIYTASWEKLIDYEFVGHDYVIDGHRLRVFAKAECVSVSGLGALTRENVENYLNKWNATVVSFSPNSVTFDVKVYDAIISEGFWSRDVSQVIFSEVSYNESTGIHRIDADYSATNWPRNAVEDNITERGGTIIAHPTGGVRFDIDRNSVFDKFKLDVKERVEGIWSRRKFKILQSDVDSAIANGGTLYMVWQEFVQRVYNRLDD